MKHNMDFMKDIDLETEARKAAREILGVKEDSSSEQLKKAYRQAACKHHPDHNQSSSDSDKQFRLIKCAYDLLAFNKQCSEIFEQIDRPKSDDKNCKYNLDNSWGRFLWWRDKFYGSPEQHKHEEKGKKKKSDRPNSCI
ncbi:Heat shock protein J [Sedimentisphaera cyanobacteriorum]|uniref:Heat shock protein J n=1 Tax=Sedimentisphaera cyanobacteriorum TaxID=1940790 RepID=A0A1Q2HQF9_9BACT|nr:J domain-containing protein [Sedimentisphaera cyanobacteriorum]AQQ09678.1 Heat shock protein J [Sedimentisphaera cyanobacteriorum]